MKSKIKTTMFFATIFLLISGCTTIFQSVIDDVDYEIVKIDINVIKNSKNLLESITRGDFSALAKANITPHIKLTNNNSIDLSIGKTDYKVFIDELQIAEGVTNSSLELKSNESSTLLLPIDINLKEIAKNKLDILLNRDMNRIKVFGKNYITTVTGDFIVAFTIHNNKVKIDSIESISKEEGK